MFQDDFKMKQQTKFKQIEIGEIPEDWETMQRNKTEKIRNFLDKIKKAVDRQIKEKNIEKLKFRNFKNLELKSVNEWKESVLNGSLSTKYTYPPLCEHKAGSITFYREILFELENCTKKLDFVEIINAFMMHECFHAYLGHQGNEGDIGEKKVNLLMQLFFPDVQKIFSDNFEMVESICRKYGIDSKNYTQN